MATGAEQALETSGTPWDMQEDKTKGAITTRKTSEKGWAEEKGTGRNKQNGGATTVEGAGTGAGAGHGGR